MVTVSRRAVMTGVGAATIARSRTAKAAGNLQVWWGLGFYQQEDQALKDLIAAFEKQYGVKVDLQIITGADLITKYIAAQQVGDVPDIVQVNTGGAFLQPQASWDDNILEVSDVLSGHEDKFLPAALASCRYYNRATKKHGYYAVPLKGGTMMEEIWRPLVEEAGFSIESIPKTQDAFYEFFQTVQDRLRSKGRRVFGLGYSMATREGDSNTLFSAFLNAYGGGGIVTPDGALHVDDEKVRKAAVTALERLTTPYKKGYVPPGSINWGDADNNNAFYARQIAMTPNATISIAVAQMEKKDQYYRDIVTTGIPLANDGSPVPSILGTVSAFIPKAAKNIDNAKSFLRFFIEPARLNGYLKEIRGRFLPVMPSALKDDPYWLDPTDPHRPVAARYGLEMPTIAPWQTFTPAYAQVISEQVWPAAEANITQKGMSPEQAAELALARIEAIFEKYPMG